MTPTEHQALIDKYKGIETSPLLEEVLYLRGMIEINKFAMIANEFTDLTQDTYFVAYTELKNRINDDDLKMDCL